MRILICGAAGMIGHAMWRALRASTAEVLGTLHRGRDEVSAQRIFTSGLIERFEAADDEAVSRLLDRLQPHVIVNCIGITKRKAEAQDVERMYRVNALFPHVLARFAGRHGSRVIQFSTDCVFGGEAGRYGERSVMSATDFYGQTKFFGELDYDGCLTIRTSMIGRELSGRTELLEWFLAQQGKTIKGFAGAKYSGLTTNHMAKILVRLIFDHPLLSGKFQVAGPVISKYELLCKARHAFGVDVRILEETEFQCDRTLQSEQFERVTGITVPSWDEMLAVLAADRELYDGTPEVRELTQRREGM